MRIKKTCSYPDCGRTHKARGYCGAHYQQLVSVGYVHDLGKPRTRVNRRCQYEGCEITVWWDFCDEHRGLCAYPECGKLRSARTEWCTSHQRLDSAFRSKFGQSLAERVARFAEDPTCAICEETPDTLHLDHDHGTEDLRDFLCGPCNRALGLMKDDPARLRAAADYLDLHRDGRL